MKHQIFLSYATDDQDLVENFADHLLRLGIKAWVYSIDKTLSADLWEEIENTLRQAELFVYVVSAHSAGASGQQRELDMAVKRVKGSAPAFKLLPIAIGDLAFSELPEALRNINGVRLSAHTVASTAHQVARQFFPDLFDTTRNQPWKCPKPGEWLEVCSIDPGIEESLSLGDQLYFRRLSPLGLFECYSQKLNGLFWILPENVRSSDQSQDIHRVPRQFRYETDLEYEILGRRLSNRPQGA